MVCGKLKNTSKSPNYFIISRSVSFTTIIPSINWLGSIYLVYFMEVIAKNTADALHQRGYLCPYACRTDRWSPNSTDYTVHNTLGFNTVHTISYY